MQDKAAEVGAREEATAEALPLWEQIDPLFADTLLKPLAINVTSRQHCHQFRVGNWELELE